MSDTVVNCLITVQGPDRVGLISAITGFLFDVGANLADANFSVLGKGCEFTAVVELPGDVPPEEVEASLKDLPPLAFSRVTVTPYPFADDAAGNAAITHIVEVRGGDRPGLVARLTEVFEDYEVNVVRLNATRSRRADGDYDYATRFAVHMPADRAGPCENAIVNTAGQLNLDCRCAPVE